jgi:hypothetical protein
MFVPISITFAGTERWTRPRNPEGANDCLSELKGDDCGNEKAEEPIVTHSKRILQVEWSFEEEGYLVRQWPCPLRSHVRPDLAVHQPKK